MLATLVREQFIPAPLGEVWDFFATPRNLDLLTPPELSFHLVSPVGERMVEGQLIEYRIGILPGIRLRWLTEIRHLREGESFVDEQRIGPYRFWYHEHRFTPIDDGVRMLDRVTYALPFGPIGWVAHKFWVGRKLRSIFDYRRQAVERIFNANGRDFPSPVAVASV